MKMRCVIILLTSAFFAHCLPKELAGPLIQTKSGKVRGHYLESYKGNKYEAYQGIPFALPPTGERRFQSPVPIEPWTNMLRATTLKEKCLQEFSSQHNVSAIGSEDCLYLNVYVPTKRKMNNSLPVIFYIYGGGFRNGGTTEDQEHYIIDYDVIFVSANYRLGALGFLRTDDDVVPGNMGLKDQSTALRWVHENIEYFGGDPKRITLVGDSAGGISIHLHYLSPWSRGLFNAGISLSGTAFGSGGVTKRSREKAVALGRLVGCTDGEVEQMVKCLKKIPAEMLVGAQNKLQGSLKEYWLFGPVIEKSSIDPFLNDYPSEILKKGEAYDVPWITGIVSEEGLLLTAGYFFYLGYMQNDTLKRIDDNWDSLAPTMLDFYYVVPKDQHVSVARKIRKHYFGDKPIHRGNLHALTNVITDRFVGNGAVNAAKAQAAATKSPVYFYYNTYRATDSMSNIVSNSTENLGVCHGDDIFLVVKDPRITPTKSSEDMAMQRLLIRMWTSVAYNGVPDVGVDWRSVAAKNGTSLDYVRLAGPDNVKPESNNDFAQTKFWNLIGFYEK